MSARKRDQNQKKSKKSRKRRDADPEVDDEPPRTPEVGLEDAASGGDSGGEEVGDAAGEIDLESADAEPAASGSRGRAANADPTDAAIPAVHRAGEYGPVSALTRYMAELRHHAPISREEEHELAVRWVEEGDVEAARKLVLSNLRLVVKIAMEYRRAWTNTLDLVQEGNVGLMEAVQRYDPYLGVKVSSYAVYWIRAYILKYILDNMRSVRMGTTRAQRKLFFRLNKEKRKLEREGYEAEPKLLAERLDVTEDDVRDMESRLSHPDVSMDAPARRDDPDGSSYGDNVAGGGPNAEQSVASAEMRRVFLEQIDVFAQDLSDREKRILHGRLLAREPLTLAELGTEFGVSRERVRQLEARLLKQLRAHMESSLVDFEYFAPSDD